MRSLIPVVAVVAAFSASFSAVPARAESSVSCAGFITSLPATISTAGTWCLGSNLNTTLASGDAVLIATSGVTLDCNGFRIQDTTVVNTTYGVRAASQLDVTVRNCTFRGFYVGASIGGGGGHLFEGNRIDGSILIGMLAGGDGIVVRDNRFSDTGTTSTGGSIGLFGTGAIDIIGNTVDGVYSHPTSGGNTSGIALTNGKGRVENNIVRNVVDPVSGISTAIAINGVGRVVMLGNDVIHSGDDGQWYGIRCSAVTPTQDVMRNNTATGFAQPFVGCTNSGDNLAWIPF
jgi:hypothetical protein